LFPLFRALPRSLHDWLILFFKATAPIYFHWPHSFPANLVMIYIILFTSYLLPSHPIRS
jgi:hypothetical protein